MRRPLGGTRRRPRGGVYSSLAWTVAVVAFLLAPVIVVAPGLPGGVLKHGFPSPAPARSPDRAGSSAPALNNVWWNELSSGINGTNPLPRQGYSMVYDPDTQEVVLFGGQDANSNALGDTWAWGDGAWTNLTSSLNNSPAPRWGASMVWDPTEGAMVLFGGRNSAGWYNDTWMFNGSQWSQHATVRAPPPMSYAQAVYDSADSYVLLVAGGNRGVGIVYNATWTFQQGVWTNITSAVKNSPRSEDIGWGAYDPALKEAVFFGGGVGTFLGNSCSGAGNTWAYAGGVWSNLTANLTLRPSALAGSGAFTFDPDINALVMFSGYGQCTPYNETWTFNTSGWTQITTPSFGTPPARWDARLAYSALDHLAVVFSGNENPFPGSNWFGTDTWGLETHLQVDMTATPLVGVAPLNVSFSAQVLSPRPPVTYNWSFGDGSSGSGGPNTSHVYSLAGRYNVSVTVSDSTTASSTASTQVHVLPSVSSFIATPSILDLGMATQLAVNDSTAGAGASLTFSGLPPGCAPSTIAVFNCTPIATGIFAVAVTVTASNGDQAFAAVALEVNPAPSVSALVAIPSPGVVNASLALLVSVSGGTGPYDFAYTGLPPGCNSADSPFLTCVPNATGIYTVAVVIQDSVGFQARGTLNVSVANASDPAGTSPIGPGSPSQNGSNGSNSRITSPAGMGISLGLLLPYAFAALVGAAAGASLTLVLSQLRRRDERGPP